MMTTIIINCLHYHTIVYIMIVTNVALYVSYGLECVASCKLSTVEVGVACALAVEVGVVFKTKQMTSRHTRRNLKRRAYS